MLVSPRKMGSKLWSPNGVTDANVALFRPAGAQIIEHPSTVGLRTTAKISRPFGPARDRPAEASDRLRPGSAANR